MLNNKWRTSGGFTIVELLIVIVVIAVLAAISIVAFNGISNRGKASAAQSAASSLDKKIEVYNTENGQYPVTTGVITGTGVQNGVTTTTTNTWYAAQGSAFTTTAGAGTTATGMHSGLAAPTDPETVYYTSYGATTGGCVWWYDFQNAIWKSMAAGSVTCPALPATAAASLTSLAI